MREVGRVNSSAANTSLFLRRVWLREPVLEGAVSTSGNTRENRLVLDHKPPTRKSDLMAEPLQIDIISDVMCPWCIIGYRQLEEALEATGTEHEIRWHPFELNPQLPPEGQSITENFQKKYASPPEKTRETVQMYADIGAELGFEFNLDDDSKMYNSFNLHQLLHWANQQGRKNDLEMALFKAHFTDGREMSDTAVLADVAAEIGLDRAEALEVLEDQRFASAVREEQKFWIDQGITGVPAVVFDRQHLVTGAQGVENFTSIVNQLTEESS